ncbi:MAG: hypothetical protein ACOX8S_06700 [Christensenellales bacterium]|jgi:hypothetical protein
MADINYDDLPGGYIHIGNVAEKASHMPTEPFQAAFISENLTIFYSKADDAVLIYSEHFSKYVLHERSEEALPQP